mmetsp:Transcript_13076/g.28113  ORF Transcript_13076/g.28113 Transcript_13076/m.28113 type:complete len:209 (-) Transcript_13076:286-912(-)
MPAWAQVMSGGSQTHPHGYPMPLAATAERRWKTPCCLAAPSGSCTTWVLLADLAQLVGALSRMPRPSWGGCLRLAPLPPVWWNPQPPQAQAAALQSLDTATARGCSLHPLHQCTLPVSKGVPWDWGGLHRLPCTCLRRLFWCTPLIGMLIARMNAATWMVAPAPHTAQWCMLLLLVVLPTHIFSMVEHLLAIMGQKLQVRHRSGNQWT